MNNMLKIVLFFVFLSFTFDANANCIRGVCENGRGIKTYTSGKYIGDWVNGKRKGEGIYMYANGDEYRGSWEDGKMTGKGTFFFANGTIQSGHFLDGKYLGELPNRDVKVAYKKK